MHVKVPYGTGQVELRLPECRTRAVAPPDPGRPRRPLEAFRAALDSPIDSAPLERLARGRLVAYMIDDATRAEPHEAFARAVIERLAGATQVRAFIATGSHERHSEGNQRIRGTLQVAARQCGVRLETSIHDCEDRSLHERLGVTSRGTPVELNRRAVAADLLIASSDVKNHYFAGYSNPLKSLLPGVSSFAAVEANHSLALEPESTFGRHPWHPDPSRRTNPVAEDMLEAAEMATPGRQVFALAAVTTAAGVLWAGAGEMEQVTRGAIGRVDELAAARVEPAPYLIVSPGGAPQDETLYNAQRGLELSRNGVRDGGEVLFIAECARGAAPTPKARAEFYDRLTAPLDEVIAGLRERYVLYSHKAYKFARFIRRVRRIHMLTALSDGEVGAAHMAKAADAQQVVDRWAAESDGPILVNPQANKVALYA